MLNKKMLIVFVSILLLGLLFAFGCTQEEKVSDVQETGDPIKLNDGEGFAPLGVYIKCDTFTLSNPRNYLGKSGNYVCNNLGYQTCVSLNNHYTRSLTVPVGGGSGTYEHNTEFYKPVPCNNLVEQTPQVNNNNGVQTEYVSCCNLVQK